MHNLSTSQLAVSAPSAFQSVPGFGLAWAHLACRFPDQAPPLWTYQHLCVFSRALAGRVQLGHPSEDGPNGPEDLIFGVSNTHIPAWQKALPTKHIPNVLHRAVRVDPRLLSPAQVAELVLMMQLTQALEAGGIPLPLSRQAGLYQISGVDPLLATALTAVLASPVLEGRLFGPQDDPEGGSEASGPVPTPAVLTMALNDPLATDQEKQDRRDEIASLLAEGHVVFAVTDDPADLGSFLRERLIGSLSIAPLNRGIVGGLYHLLHPVNRSLRPDDLPQDDDLATVSVTDLALLLCTELPGSLAFVAALAWLVGVDEVEAPHAGDAANRFELPIPRTAAMQAWDSYQELMQDRLIDAPHPKISGSIGPDGQVYHKHHIVMKKMAPTWAQSDWNEIRLNLKEHWEAHLLLAQIFPERRAPHATVEYMWKLHRDGSDIFDVEQVQASLVQAYRASSIQQAVLREQDWQRLEYRQQMSAAFSLANLRKWKREAYRRSQSAATFAGRLEKFYSDPEKVRRATAAQSEKTSAEKHWRHQPVNIYLHYTGALVALGVNLTDYCKQNGLNQAHMHTTLTADRSKPCSRDNRSQHQGFFARRVTEQGEVIGSTGPAVPQVHHRARLANIYRDEDDVCVARGVVITRFCRDNALGITFSQSALSRTAHADRTQHSTAKMPTHHKGYYARYLDDDAQGENVQTRA